MREELQNAPSDSFLVAQLRSAYKDGDTAAELVPVVIGNVFRNLQR